MICHGIRTFLSNNRQFRKSEHINNATDMQESKDEKMTCRRAHAENRCHLSLLIDTQLKWLNVICLKKILISPFLPFLAINDQLFPDILAEINGLLYSFDHLGMRMQFE